MSFFWANRLLPGTYIFLVYVRLVVTVYADFEKPLNHDHEKIVTNDPRRTTRMDDYDIRVARKPGGVKEA